MLGADLQTPTAAARPFILLVDDEPANLLTLYEILKADCELHMARDGAEALELCGARHPDLILLDVSMPNMDGHEACRRLKADETTRDTPVIFITAHDAPNDEAHALGEGAADFIGKPVHERVVRARVNTQLALKRQAEQLRALASTDGLTRLANRRRFDEAFDQEWRRGARDAVPLSLLLLDVDHFKRFNDTYGHAAGDECLRAVASVAGTAARRPGDLAARYGGEEIAVLLPRADGQFAVAAAERLRAEIEALAIAHAGNDACGGFVTVSIGVATIVPTDTNTPAALFACADERLYASKHGGRNRVTGDGAQERDTRAHS